VNLQAEASIASEPLQAEYLLTATRPGHQLCGVETGLHTALSVARGLAVGGWHVTVRGADPYLSDSLVMEVWSEDAP